MTAISDAISGNGIGVQPANLFVLLVTSVKYRKNCQSVNRSLWNPGFHSIYSLTRPDKSLLNDIFKEFCHSDSACPFSTGR